MNSNELMSAQEIIENIICELIKSPIKNWALIRQYQSALKDIDIRRRKLWHDEKFGVYEQIADEVLNNNYSIESDTDFTMDDIPF